MKQIIFIGGTSHSGSTLLDMILANDPTAMSLGEIHALLHPTKKHHFEKRNQLKSSKVWSKAIYDKENLYSNLFESFPEINTFVDSSKDPFWIKFHDERNSKYCNTHNVLIYKSPAELAKSYHKRGNIEGWIKPYIHYHKKYFTIIEDFVSIAYREMVEDRKTLKTLCSHIDLDYFPGKEEYWQKEHNTFFGSNSVRKKGGHKSENELSETSRRDLTYDGVERDEILNHVEKVEGKNPAVNIIKSQLDQKNVNSKMNIKDCDLLKYTKLMIFMMYSKQLLKRAFRYFFPRDQFSDK